MNRLMVLWGVEAWLRVRWRCGLAIAVAASLVSLSVAVTASGVSFATVSARIPPGDGVASPDGKRIAWVSEDGRSVWSARRTARGKWRPPERLLTIRGTVRNLVFSPDSKRIAFENPRHSGNSLHGFADHGFIAVYRLRADRVLFVDPSFASDTDPVWSADGRHISFVRHVEGVPDERLTRPVPTRRSSVEPADAERSRPFSIESLLATPFVNQLTRSADGRAIAYAAREANNRAIYSMRVGERVRRVVEYPRDDGQELSQVTLASHGGAIAYVRGQPPNSQGEIPNPNSLVTPPERQVWIVGGQGDAPHLLGPGTAPRFSSDDERIVWIRGQRVMSARLTWTDGRLHDVGSPEELFAFEGSVSMLRFSPDGKRLAYQRAAGIELYDLATDTTSAIAHPGASDAAPSWSPDGDRIAFQRTAPDQPFAIWVADVPSLQARQVWQAEPGLGSAFYGLDQEDQLLWSHDGRIAFAWERDGWRHLYSVPASGGAATLLTPGDGEVEAATPTFDRTQLIYATNIGDLGRRHLGSIDFDATAAAQLTSGSTSQWAPTPLAGGRLAYIHAGWADPPRVWIHEPDDATTAATLPRIPGSFPAAELVEPELVEFPASDGQTAYGQLFVPAAPNGCAVVFAHGGPRRQMLPGFHYIEVYTQLYELNQYLASQGCVVLSVEYRGGVMHGYAFRNAPNQGRQGASEYQDILGAAAYLQGRPDVDQDRLGIHGLSWGGYLAALALARDSEAFKVGFDQAGVHEFFGSEFPYSPMANINNWTSPVYLAQGDDDENVAFSQSVFLARALRSRHVQLAQHAFPDEIHEMHLTFKHLVDLYGEGSRFLLDRLKPVARTGL